MRTGAIQVGFVRELLPCPLVPDSHDAVHCLRVGQHEQRVVVRRGRTGLAGLTVLRHHIGENGDGLGRRLGPLEDQPGEVGESSDACRQPF